MKAMPTSDLRLLEEWRSRRDADAFREIVSRHASMVYATARRLVGNPADAEDVAQDCFTRLATNDAIRIKSSLSGWLHHVAVGSARDHLRREARRRGRESRAVAQTGGGASTLEAILPLVDEAIDELPDDLRDVLVRHYLEGESYETIAERLGMSRRAATYRAQKAIRLVRRRLRSSGVHVAFVALAAALSNGRLEAAPATLQTTLGKVAVAGLRMEPAGRAIVPSSAAAGGAAGLGTAKVAGVALAIIALGLGGILFYGLHRHGDGEAGDTAVDRAGAKTTAARSQPSGPGASLGGVEPSAAPKEDRVSPDAQAPAPAFVITGRVTDSISREPLENAIVELSFEQEVETDSGGRYRLDVGAGNHEVGAGARGYARTRVSAAVTDPGETVVDLALDPVVEVIVQVADAEGVPLVGVTVTPSDEEDGGHYDDRDSAVTDLRGEAIVLRNSRFGATGPRFLAQKQGYSQNEVSDIALGNDGKQRVAIVLEDISRNARAVTGRVTAWSGDPVPGALVTWNDGSVGYGPDGVVRKETASTDLEGRYHLEFHHQKTRFSFLAHARGFAPAWIQEVDAGTAAAPATLDFVLDPGRAVEGEVVGEDGEPLPGAKVAALGPGGFWNLEDILSTVPHTAITDDRGRFAITDVPEGFVSLQVSRTGWSSGEFSGLPTGERHRLTLYRPGIVRGRVVDSEGKPVSNFTVKVDRGSHRKTGVAFTSTEGRFTIERLHRSATSSFTFRIEAEGYAPAYLRDVRPEPEEREASEHVVRLVNLGAATELAGKVLDARSRRPLSDVRVCAGVPRFEELAWIDWMLQQMDGFAEARTDGKGAFRFQEGEPLTLFIRAPGYRREVVTPAMRPDRSDYGASGVVLEIALEPGESIVGTCAELPGGKRPRGAGLFFLRETGTPGEPLVRDSYGFHELAEKAGTSFAWDDLHPGPYLVFFDDSREPGTTTERIYHRVELREGSRESVRLGEDLGNLSFEGRLMDGDGRPALQTSLILRPLFAWNVEFECFSHDQQGSFSFRHLKPGRYAVEAARYHDGKRQALELEAVVVEADTRRDLTVKW